MKNENFNQLVNVICETKDISPLRTVVEKELLHYDILFALSQSGLLNKLTFQGGTALRLCYKLQRFSEDLDFVGGTEFTEQNLLDLKDVIENYIGKRYGLEVLVKEPKQNKSIIAEEKVSVKKWQIAVLTQPGRNDLPKQKIRIEVANVPAHTRELRPILSNYDFLPDGYSEIFINVESLDEIMADKIIDYAARNYIKSRDIWDLQWLLQQDVELNMELIRRKITDYKIENFQHLLKNRLMLLDEATRSKKFMEEMTRFLSQTTIERTIDRDGFFDYIIKNLTDLLNTVLTELSETKGSTSEFLL